MAVDGFEIKGISELQAKLNDLGTKAAERATRKALRAGAQIVQAAITERAPVKGLLRRHPASWGTQVGHHHPRQRRRRRCPPGQDRSR
ncbi:HK97 gp10 family phage protein [Tunturiibacter gelidiferens]|uniref:HK97 gp10 family phage protein n=1 Tax=Tunturiibacter gelidiferens TaxID=3069689 RepID=UPI003D9B8B03